MNKGQINGLISPMLERSRLRNIAKYIHGPKILDVGCGRCSLRDYVKGFEYHGIEKDVSIDVPEGTTIFYCNIEDKIDGIGKYDSIVLSEVIEHLKDPGKAISKLKEHLKENGIIILCTSIPLRYKMHKYTSIIGLTDKEAEDEHKSLLGKKEIYRLAEENGLEVKKYARTELWTKQIAILGK